MATALFINTDTDDSGTIDGGELSELLTSLEETLTEMHMQSVKFEGLSSPYPLIPKALKVLNS